MNKKAGTVLGCYILWGMLPVFWKLLAQVNSLYILAGRIAWSFVFCGAIFFLFGKRSELKVLKKNYKQMLLIIGCGVMVTVNWGSYIWAVNSGHILEGSLAYFMNPIFTILLGFFLFNEKLGTMKWISVGIAFAGILVSVIQYGTIPWLSFIIGISFAIYSVLKKKVILSSNLSLLLETMVILPVAIPFMIYMETHGMGSSGILHGWQFLLLPLSGIITSVPLLLFAYGIKETPLSLSGILMYINPTLQMLIGTLFYQEKLETADWITFTCVWCALILFLVSNQKERKTMRKEQITLK